MPEHPLTLPDGRVFTAEEFARKPVATMLSTEAFVLAMRDLFGITGYERLHELMELRHAAPTIYPEGSDLA